MNNSVIIVAGGKGLRMGAGLPKQFIPVGGKPLLMHTLTVFYTFDPVMDIILVLPGEQHLYWEQLCSEYHFDVPHNVVTGGDTRFHSVKSGLEQVKDNGFVAIHDGVRPFVAPEVLKNCFMEVVRFDAVIPVVDILETVRLVEGDNSSTVDRSKYKSVQTPQVFSTRLIKEAYLQAWSSAFTDDASVVEALGRKVHLIEGNRENIKITTPFDLKIAEILLDV